MIPIQNITGRIGNQMFQFAFLYNYAVENDIDRYVQDPKYFEENKDEIRSIFGEGIPGKTDMVAIHVRRGDYVTSHNHMYVNLAEATSYYEQAMDLFPDSDFVVFSDDIEWCKEQDMFKDCEFSHGTEIEDMNNMASCTGHIIANSSFSWWAAFISPYSEKIVAPSVKNWYTDNFERTVCPKEWIRI